MKKKIAAALAATFALGVTTVFANNPFVDVPAKHWAYESVNKLAKAGIVDGYGDGTFRGDKTMTRYEMAQIVAKAMTKLDKADAEQKAMINKLSAEFGTELKNLGVKVAALEANASSVKITADARLRYKKNEIAGTNGAATTDNKFANRLRLYINGNISQDVSFAGRLTGENGTLPGVSGGENVSTTIDFANFTYKNAFNTVDLSAGRFSLGLGYGLLSGTTGGYDAFQVAFGGKLVKAVVAHGDNGLKAASNNAVVTTANIVYTPNKDFQALATAYVSNDSDYRYKIFSVGAKGKLSPVFTLTGEYAKNSDAPAGNDDKAYFLQLGYKGADKAVPGSFGVFAQYWKAGNKAVDHKLSSLPVFEALTTDTFIGTNGIKSLGFGVNYTFTKNAIFTLTYQDPKSYDGSIKRDKYTYARTEFWF